MTSMEIRNLDLSSSPAIARLSTAFDPPGFLEELNARLSALGEIVPRPIEAVEIINSFGDRPSRVDFEMLSTGGASDRRIVLKPCERLLKLMSTLRTFQGSGELVLENHGNLPSIGASASMLARAPAARTARPGRPDAAEGEQS